MERGLSAIYQRLKASSCNHLGAHGGASFIDFIKGIRIDAVWYGDTIMITILHVSATVGNYFKFSIPATDVVKNFGLRFVLLGELRLSLPAADDSPLR